MKIHPPALGCALAAALALSVCGMSGSRGAADEPAEPPYLDLVRQLGAASFATRERAEQRLLQIGIAAKPALLQGTRDEDLEVRLATQRILIRVVQDDFDTCAAAFVQGSDHVPADRFPGWRQFRERVSDDRAARRLFTDMIRAESALLTALEHNDPTLLKQFAEKLQALTDSVGQPNVSRAPVSAPALAAWLFVGAEVWDRTTNTEHRQAFGALTRWLLFGDAATLQTILQSSKPALLKQLLALWTESIAKDDDGGQCAYAMQLVLKYDLQESGVRLAREVLEKTAGAGAVQNQAATKPYAAIVLARFGSEDDARYLVPHLDDTRVFHTWSNPQLQQEPIRIQVRDVILAMLLRLHGLSPEACGFELLEPLPETLYRIWTFGFLNERDRDEVFARWREAAGGRPAPRSDKQENRRLTNGEPQTTK